MSLYEKFSKLSENKLATVFLTNGVKLSGKVTSVESDGFLLERDGVRQYVARLAIATIMPQDPNVQYK